MNQRSGDPKGYLDEVDEVGDVLMVRLRITATDPDDYGGSAQ